MSEVLTRLLQLEEKLDRYHAPPQPPPGLQHQDGVAELERRVGSMELLLFRANFQDFCGIDDIVGHTTHTKSLTSIYEDPGGDKCLNFDICSEVGDQSGREDADSEDADSEALLVTESGMLLGPPGSRHKKIKGDDLTKSGMLLGPPGSGHMNIDSTATN